jgi:histidine triad (HIT) family protein
MSQECIFCKIANNEVKSFRIYEDEKILAFLDINPVGIGHTLIIPKEHYENVFDIPKEILEKIISVAKTLSEKYKEKLNATGINILHASEKDAQQSVFHFHIHLVPRYSKDGIDLWFHKYSKSEIKLEEVFRRIME